MRIILVLMALMVMPTTAAWAEYIDAESFHQKCVTQDASVNMFDCDCLLTKLKEAYALDGSGKWENAHMRMWLGTARECVPPQRIHTLTLKNCTEKSYEANLYLDTKKVGKERFCKCVADETVERLKKVAIDMVPYLTTDNNRAMLDCKTRFASAE